MNRISHSRLFGASLMVLLASCATTGPGPGDLEGLLTPQMVEAPPIYALIGARSELELTSAQVAALDSIATAIQARNRPLIERLDSVTGGTSARGARIITPEGEPILEAIRANTRQASEAVSSLLTEAQRAEICTLFRRDDADRVRGSRPAPRGSAAAGRGGLPVVWFWCAPPESDSEAVS